VVLARKQQGFFRVIPAFLSGQFDFCLPTAVLYGITFATLSLKGILSGDFFYLK